MTAAELSSHMNSLNQASNVPTTVRPELPYADAIGKAGPNGSISTYADGYSTIKSFGSPDRFECTVPGLLPSTTVFTGPDGKYSNTTLFNDVATSVPVVSE